MSVYTIFSHYLLKHSDQPMVDAIVINTVLAYMSANVIRNFFQQFRSITHCYAMPHGLEHFNIVISIPKGQGCGSIQMIKR